MGGEESRESFDVVYSLVYEELRYKARGLLRREAIRQTTPTTLVNEAWLKLVRSPETANTSPLHFRRIASRVMRQILVDIARQRGAASRGGGLFPVTFEEDLLPQNPARDHDVIALDAALDELSRINPRQAMVVEARFFGGFSCDECCEMLEISEATLMRDWRVARAWLAQAIRQ